MSEWRSCENCAYTKCRSHINLEFPSIGCCTEFQPLRCRCGGALSETRYHNGRPYRHCYSCHMEFYTVDGSRFEYIAESEHEIDDMPSMGLYGFPVEGGIKWFNMQNVVSVTVTEVNE